MSCVIQELKSKDTFFVGNSNVTPETGFMVSPYETYAYCKTCNKFEVFAIALKDKIDIRILETVLNFPCEEYFNREIWVEDLEQLLYGDEY